jgi:AraC-like DNA-binding protein
MFECQGAAMRTIDTLFTPRPEIKSGTDPERDVLPSRSLLLDDIFGRARTLIDATYYDCQLNPQVVARLLRCSRATLYRAFHRHGLTVSGYIQQVRLERVQACLAVAAPRIPISSIAMDCGFECVRHFHRRFKQVFGDTPGAHRNVLRRASMSPETPRP